MDRNLMNKLLDLGQKLKKAREYEDQAAQIYGLVAEEFRMLLGSRYNIDFGGVIPVTGRELIASIAEGDGQGNDCVLCVSEHGKPVRVRFPR